MNSLNDILSLTELKVKEDRISRVVYTLNGKYYSTLASMFKGEIIKRFDYENVEITETKDKLKTGKAVRKLSNSADKEVLPDNGDPGLEIPSSDEKVD